MYDAWTAQGMHADQLLQLNRNRLHTFNLEPFTARSSLAPALYLYWLFLLRSSRLTRGPTH